jgi:hypothetical protein
MSVKQSGGIGYTFLNCQLSELTYGSKMLAGESSWLNPFEPFVAAAADRTTLRL